MSKISVVIPCHFLHFNYLYNLCKIYERQTYLPHEIVIVLSEFNRMKYIKIKELKNIKFKFNVKIIEVLEKSPAGNNRYIGSKKAEGDIIVFQDADDIPHFQRLEIINKIFQDNPEINHLTHAYSKRFLNIAFKLDKIPTQIFTHNMFNDHKEMAKYSLHNGAIGIRKDIIDKIEWERKLLTGQDVKQNRHIFRKYGKFILIKLPLYFYRRELSLRYKV